MPHCADRWVTKTDLARLLHALPQQASRWFRPGGELYAALDVPDRRDARVKLDHPAVRALAARRGVDLDGRSEARCLATLEELAALKGVPIDDVLDATKPGGPLHAALVPGTDGPDWLEIAAVDLSDRTDGMTHADLTAQAEECGALSPGRRYLHIGRFAASLPEESPEARMRRHG